MANNKMHMHEAIMVFYESITADSQVLTCMQTDSDAELFIRELRNFEYIDGIKQLQGYICDVTCMLQAISLGNSTGHHICITNGFYLKKHSTTENPDGHSTELKWFLFAAAVK
jgi:hypothetical protein